MQTFPEFLAQLRDGEEVMALTEELHTALAAAEEYGRPATITMALTLEPRGSGKWKATLATTTKLPKADAVGTTLFEWPDRSLQRRQPGQRTLEDITGARD